MSSKKWTAIKVSSTPMKKSMVRALVGVYGPDVTLGDISEMPVSDLEHLYGVGPMALQSCYDVLARALRGEQPAGATVLSRATTEARGGLVPFVAHDVMEIGDL